MALPLSILRGRPVASTLVLGSIGAGIIVAINDRNIHADTGQPRKVFGKGPAFVSLPLESTEIVNHNTKRLRFKLPHADDVSGLSVTCMPDLIIPHKLHYAY
jgi:cytochrome-b5 reductase